MAEKLKDIKERKFICHDKSVEISLNLLETEKSGLNDDEVVSRQEKFGRNELPGKKKIRFLSILLSQFKSPLIYILLAAVVISGILQEFKDMIFIIFVILLNAALGSFQEWKAEKSSASLQEFLKSFTLVIRNGRQTSIRTEGLVPGDIVILNQGNKVPADIRLISQNNLTLDESILTGESLPSDKTIEIMPSDIQAGDCQNMVFAGTRVLTGKGIGLVTAIGLSTEIGQIASQVYTSKSEKPPLIIRMDRFSRQIGFIVIGFAVILAILGIYRGFPYSEIFLLAIALAVAAIPEGLPVAMTVALSISTSRMAKRNVIVRKLAAVESLGSCTLIASDKTGTLTLNKQTLKIIQTGDGERFLVTGEGYEGSGEVVDQNGKKYFLGTNKLLSEIARSSVADNNSTLLKEKDEWIYEGSPIEVALLAFSNKIGLDYQEFRNNITVLHEITFDSQKKYSAKIFEEAGAIQVALKGAPEIVLSFCSRMLDSNDKISEINYEKINDMALQLTKEGYRVIAIAKGLIGDKNEIKNYKPQNLILLGLAGFIDPLRPDAKAAVNECIAAGIKVVMITGDHPGTAAYIGRDLGIINSEDEIITGGELGVPDSDDDENFSGKVKDKKIFARVTPLQKLHIIEFLKRAGHFVAATGDGVNDAPALKKANIGVAMGSGTDVTKDTASIIITDDSFSSIVAGVEEGRFAYDNVRKVTYLLISTGMAEVFLFIASLIMGLPIAFLAVQLLWLNLVTNGIQDIALAFEAGEKGAMKLPPRRPTEGVFNKLMLSQVLISGIWIGAIVLVVWNYLINKGYDVESSRNYILLLMVMLENFHVFNCRSERVSAFKVPLKNNYILMGGIIAAQLIHIGAMYIPFMQKLLGVSPVTFIQWAQLLAVASSIILIMEIFKLIKNKLAKPIAVTR